MISTDTHQPYDMAGDNTTPDPLFKDVLRRPRSATERRPRKEELDTGGSSVSTASNNNNGGGECESPSKATAGFFPNKAHVTDALRSILAGLDASDPVLVYQKQMPPSDRCKGQNRLLMSCKCESSRRAAFASVLREAETTLVHRPPAEDEKHGDGEQGNRRRSAVVHGLAVQAYDRDGRAYELSLKYLSSNSAYRIVGPDYTVFLKNNGLLVGGGPKRSRQLKKRRRSGLLADEEEQPAVRDAAAGDDVQMELWAFRSPKLSVGEKDQPDGALGLLLLHRRGGEAGAGAGQVRVGGAAATTTTEVAEPREVVVVDDDAAVGNNAVTRSTRDMPMLSAAERLIACVLSYGDRHSHTADVNDNGEADANDKQGPN